MTNIFILYQLPCNKATKNVYQTSFLTGIKYAKMLTELESFINVVF
jgi:hypothetical protein